VVQYGKRMSLPTSAEPVKETQLVPFVFSVFVMGTTRVMTFLSFGLEVVYVTVEIRKPGNPLVFVKR
jgi:hypothetical protein